MNPQDAFDRLKNQFVLKDSDFYFLDLIPLIKIIWADGRNQESELQILYKFVIEHVAYLDQQAGVRAITVEHANDFLDRFAHQKPSDRLLDELLTISVLLDSDKQHTRRRTILEYCLDIAAACTTEYPFDLRGRIIQEEIF